MPALERRLPPAAALFALFAASCASAPPSRSVQSPADAQWVERTLSRLTLEQKAAQVEMPRISTWFVNRASDTAREMESLARDLGVGGFLVSRGDPLETVATLNRLQSLARVPLLVSADFEAGTGSQLPHGAVVLQGPMAVGATGSEEMAERIGRATAADARALGIHLDLAPVVDVNNNPENPIINVRSYGEDPDLVSRLSTAFIRGAHAGGMLTTAKHFPGHGDTVVDSHRERTEISADRARLETVELPPFRAAVTAGADAVMIGHLAVPALDPSGLPATVSRPMVTDLLRGQMGFRGLVITDAMSMRGVADLFSPGDAAVRALLAGQDLLLVGEEPLPVRDAIVAAVREGRLPAARLDEAVRRVLEAKVKAGLHRRALVDPERVWMEMSEPSRLALAQEVADRAVTLVRNEGVLPLRVGTKLLHVTLSGDLILEPISARPEEEVRRRCPEAAMEIVDPRTGREQLAAVLARAAEADAVLVSAFVRVRAAKGTAAMPEHLALFLRDLVKAGKPLAVVTYGSPYLLRQFPEVPAYLCTYGMSPLLVKSASKVVFGEMTPTGRLPVSLPGLFARGHGLDLARPAATR